MSEVKTVTLTIDGNEVTVPAGSSLMEAATASGVEIPRFCFHKRLSVAGNCRMCLVEVEGGPPKPTASCCFPAGDGMVVHTKSDMVKDARKGVMEFLLINHPLDCPICDQAGECDLQDISVSYGSDCSSYSESKRVVEDKDLGPKIKTVMTRCIHCTRCIRFATEVAGVQDMGATFRGENMKVGTYVESALQSELSGNMIDLCPVGALTSKPYEFSGRNWELVKTDAIDVMDGLGSNIEVHTRAGKVMRIVPRENDDVNEEWISDSARFSYDGLYENRLTSPLVKGKNKKLQSVGWKKAFETLLPKLNSKKTIAGLAGDIHSVEDLYSFNAFMKNTLSTANVDARMNGFKLDGTSRSSYIFNTTIEGIDNADAIILVGTNPRLEAPVLNARIRKAVRERNVPVYMVGAEVDLTYNYGLIGETPEDLENLASAKGSAFKALKEFKKPMVIVGAEALGRKDGSAIYKESEKLANALDAINSHWNGFNVLHNKAGLVAALDMNVTPAKGGMDTVKTLKALKDKKVDVLVLYGESDYVKAEDLKGAKFTVFIGTHKSSYAEIADVVLPAAAYTEKDGWWVNTEGRVQEGKAATSPLLNAKEDWKIFRALSGELGKALPFDDLITLREIISKDNKPYRYINEISYADEWIDVPTKGKLQKAAFTNTVNDFYKTNEIMKASKVMTNCARSKEDKQSMKKVS